MNVYLVLKGHSATKCVPVAGLARTVEGAAPALIMALVAPWTAHVSAILAGLAVTAHSHVLRVSGVPTAFTLATVTMEHSAVLMTASVNVRPAGQVSTAHKDVHWVSMVRIVCRHVNVRMVQTAITSRVSAHAVQASWDVTVKRNVLRVHMDMAAGKFVIVSITPPVIT